MKKQTAIQMITSGYDVETVMDILGMEPEELFSILNEKMESDMMGMFAPGCMVTWITQCFHSNLVGEFEVSLS